MEGCRLDPDRFEVTVRGATGASPAQGVRVARAPHGELGPSARLARRFIDRIWGPDYFGDTRTLDVHIKRLRAKCEENPHTPAHLVTIRGLGYKFVPYGVNTPVVRCHRSGERDESLPTTTLQLPVSM